MLRENSGTRLHILETAEKLLSERRSDEIHIADIVDRASVGVQTIYYHFGSLGRLIAEAQAFAYIRTAEPLHAFLLAAEKAVVENDEPTYWQATGDNVMLAWTYGFSGDRWKIPMQLIDVWADPVIRREFTGLLDAQFERWVNVIEGGKARGWVSPGIDTHALIASCWGGSNGQGVFAGTSKIHFTPETIRDFWVEIVKAKRYDVPDIL